MSASPFLAAIDALRASIARDQELLKLLEDRVGATTVSALPAPSEPAPAPARPRAARPAKPAQPASRARRGGHPSIPDDQVRALHARGLTIAKIAAELGRSGPGVANALRRLGLEPNRFRPDAPEPDGQASDPSVITPRDLVAWLREINVAIDVVKPGESWRVNGRSLMNRHELLEFANAKRARMQQPAFTWAP